jgi:hypothetical protein
MRKVILWLPLGALILLLLSCPSSVQTGGSLVINLPLTGMQDPKSPDPDIVSSYDVLGAGPGNTGFQRLGIKDTSVTIDSLAPGDWGVTVNGKNFLNAAIASTSVSVTIIAGETAAAVVAASQLVSSGTLELSLNWTASPDTSSVVVSLTPQGGVPDTVTLPAVANVNGISSVHASVEVPAGYYTLSRVYRDDMQVVTWGAADALRITFGSTTKLALSGGDVTITPDILKFVHVTSDNGKGEVVTFTAAPTPPPSMKVTSFSYQWYLNGVLQNVTAPTITINMNDHGPGNYRLDVVVSAKGDLSSDGVTFTVK